VRAIHCVRQRVAYTSAQDDSSAAQFEKRRRHGCSRFAERLDRDRSSLACLAGPWVPGRGALGALVGRKPRGPAAPTQPSEPVFVPPASSSIR
jgi:hypothetical protein